MYIQFCNSIIQNFEGGPDDGNRGGDISNEKYQELTEEEREIFGELQDIHRQIDLVVSAKEITADYRQALMVSFSKVLDNVSEVTDEDLNDPNSDYNKLINKIRILTAHLEEYADEELRLKLLEVQGQTTTALQDLMGDVLLYNYEISVEQRGELFQEAYDAMGELVDDLDMTEEQKEYLKKIISEAGGLDKISANDIYLMKSAGIDLAALFLINSSGRTSKDTMEEGDVLFVNFGGNYSVDSTIGAGDILDIANVYKVKVNGVEGVRGYSPRPGYYTSDGRYLAIHDGYKLEISEKKAFDPETENAEDFENAVQERISTYRKEKIDAWMYENVFTSEETTLQVPFIMDVDRGIISEYIESELNNEILFNTETGILSVKPPYASFEKALEEHFASLGNFEPRPGEHLARDPAFLAKLNTICSRLGVNPEHMLIVMRAESGINPNLENRLAVQEGRPGAVGLIQFMPSTARGLGTSREALLRMSGVEQLDWVYKYFEPYSGRLNAVEDLYKATFFPAAIGKPLGWVFQSRNLSPSSIARENAGIAKHSTRPDGFIDGYTFRRYVQEHIRNV